MPIGTCDPATRGEAFNQTLLEAYPVLVDIHWGWDGVSTFETGCDGPVLSIHVTNTGTVSVYANLPGKKKGDHWIEIPPGTDVTYQGGQLNSLGLTKYKDTNDLTLSLTPG